jgi:hypothetical protein
MYYKAQILLEGYFPLGMNSTGDCLVFEILQGTHSADCPYVPPTGKPKLGVLIDGRLNLLPSNFATGTLDDLGRAYGSVEGRAAIWDEGGIVTLGQGHICTANNHGLCAGYVSAGEAAFPAIWKDRKLVWQGESQGKCVTINAQGLVGINYLVGKEDDLDYSPTRAVIWHDGVESPLLGPEGTDTVTVTRICDDGVVLGYQYDDSLDELEATSSVYRCAGIVWKNNLPRVLPQTQDGKGMVPLHRGPSGEIVGKHMIEAEFPMSGCIDYVDSDFIMSGSRGVDFTGRVGAFECQKCGRNRQRRSSHL